MTAEWWALGISIIALLATLTKDFVIPWIFKPKLILEGKNDDECVDDALSETMESRIFENDIKTKGLQPEDFNDERFRLKQKSRWIRIRIINASGFFSRTATNCYIKLIEIRNSKNQPIRPFNAFPLMWVSYASAKNDLAKGEYHLLDLVFENEKERVLYPAVYGHFGLPLKLLSRKEEKLGPDVYTFKVGVYGDNFDPIFKEFKIELTKKFGELKFAE